jgi:hypothetical protein
MTNNVNVIFRIAIPYTHTGHDESRRGGMTQRSDSDRHQRGSVRGDAN